MNDLPAIAASYTGVDNFLGSFRDTASGSGGGEIEQKLRINDQAYFVLAWGQLESAIDEACRRAIDRGRNQRDWRQRLLASLVETLKPVHDHIAALSDPPKYFTKSRFVCLIRARYYLPA